MTWVDDDGERLYLGATIGDVVAEALDIEAERVENPLPSFELG